MDNKNMINKFGVLLTGTAIASVMTLMPVGEVKASKTQFLLPVNDWQVGVVPAASDQQPAYCAMANQFQDGVVVAIAKDKDGVASLALDFKKSFLRPQSHHEVIVEIDQNISRKLNAVATNSRALVVQLGQDDALMKALNNNGQLDVSFAKMRYSFALESFDQTFSRLENCRKDLNVAAVQPAAGDINPVANHMVVNSQAQMEQEIAQVQSELSALHAEKANLIEARDASRAVSEVIELAENTVPVTAVAPAIVKTAMPHIPKKDPERAGFMREMKQIKVQNVALSQQVTEQKTVMAGLQDRIDGYLTEKQDLATRIQFLERQISAHEMTKQPPKSAQDFLTLEQDLKQKSVALQSLRQENLVLQDLLSQKEMAISQATPQADNEDLLQALRLEKRDLEDRLDVLQATTSDASIKLSEKEAEITRLKNTQDEMAQRLKTLKQSDIHTVSSEEHQKMRQERDQLQTRVAELTKLTKVEEMKMSDASDISQTAKKQLQNLRQENLILQQQVTELTQSKMSGSDDNTSDLTQSLQEKIIQIEAQEIQLTKLRSELEVMNTAFVALQQEKKELQLALATAQENKPSAPEQTDTVLMLNELLKEQKVQLSGMRQENLSLLQNLTKSEERIHALELKTADYVTLDKVPENVSAELSLRKADAELTNQKNDLMRMQSDHQAQVESLEIEKAKWAKIKNGTIDKNSGDTIAQELQTQRQAHLMLQAEKEAADNRIAELEANIRQIKESQSYIDNASVVSNDTALLEARKVIAQQADKLSMYQNKFGMTTPNIPAEETLQVVALPKIAEARQLASPPTSLRTPTHSGSGIQVDLGALAALGIEGIPPKSNSYSYDLGKHGYFKPEIEVNDKAFAKMDAVQPKRSYQQGNGQMMREELPFIALKNPKNGQKNRAPNTSLQMNALKSAAPLVQNNTPVSSQHSIVIRKVLHEARIPVRQFNTDSYRTSFGQVVQYEKWNNDVLNGIHETMPWAENAGFEVKSKGYIDRYKEDCSEPLQFRNESYEQQKGHHMAIVTLFCPAPNAPYLTASILYGQEGNSFEVVAMTANIDQEQKLYKYRDQYLETFTRLNPAYQF